MVQSILFTPNVVKVRHLIEVNGFPAFFWSPETYVPIEVPYTNPTAKRSTMNPPESTVVLPSKDLKRHNFQAVINTRVIKHNSFLFAKHVKEGVAKLSN